MVENLATAVQVYEVKDMLRSLTNCCATSLSLKGSDFGKRTSESTSDALGCLCVCA